MSRMGDWNGTQPWAARMVCPAIPNEEMGISVGLRALVTPLARHIRAGGALIDGLTGPGAYAMRVELLTEVDRPDRLFQAALDAGHSTVKSLEGSLARLALPQTEFTQGRVRVLAVQHITNTPVTEYMRLKAARRALVEEPDPDMAF